MSAKPTELNIHLLDAHDLVRWVEPTTELEKVLLGKLREFTDETGHYAEMKEEIETAQQELQEEKQSLEEAEAKIKILEDELEEDKSWITEQEDALAEANRRIDELTEELANTIT